MKDVNWKVTLLSGVSNLNDASYDFDGSASEAAADAVNRLHQDAQGDSPEYHGFSIESKR